MWFMATKCLWYNIMYAFVHFKQYLKFLWGVLGKTYSFLIARPLSQTKMEKT